MRFLVTAIASGLMRGGGATQLSPREQVLAKAQMRAARKRDWLVFLVAAPTLAAIAYFGVLASKRYVSEGDFIVRGMSSRRASGLEMLFRTFGISRAIDDANAVQSYMLSRDAVRALEKRLPLREIFSRREVDRFARFPRFWRDDSFERLFDYYLERVSVTQDSTKGITTLQVIAFQPADAQKIAMELMRLAEEMVNRMNTRAQTDALRAAQADLTLAEERVIKTQMALTAFRNRELLIDPAKNSAGVLETITSLSTEFAHLQAQLQETSRSAPTNPSLQTMQERLDALTSRITVERSKLAGGDSALATKVATYEQLALTRELAEKALAAAHTSLDVARQEARRQQIYIEEIVAPNLPDESTEPQRLRLIAATFVVSFFIAAILWILSAGAREHAS